MFGKKIDASQLQVFLLPANFKSDGMTSHKHGLAAKYSFKMAASEVVSFKTNFFKILGTSEAETSVARKTRMFTCNRQRQKK